MGPHEGEGGSPTPVCGPVTVMATHTKFEAPIAIFPFAKCTYQLCKCSWVSDFGGKIENRNHSAFDFCMYLASVRYLSVRVPLSLSSSLFLLLSLAPLLSSLSLLPPNSPLYHSLTFCPSPAPLSTYLFLSLPLAVVLLSSLSFHSFLVPCSLSCSLYCWPSRMCVHARSLSFFFSLVLSLALSLARARACSLPSPTNIFCSDSLRSIFLCLPHSFSLTLSLYLLYFSFSVCLSFSFSCAISLSCSRFPPPPPPFLPLPLPPLSFVCSLSLSCSLSLLCSLSLSLFRLFLFSFTLYSLLLLLSSSQRSLSFSTPLSSRFLGVRTLRLWYLCVSFCFQTGFRFRLATRETGTLGHGWQG